MILVHGRIKHPVIQDCRTLEEAELVRAAMIAQGYSGVRITKDFRLVKNKA